MSTKVDNLGDLKEKRIIIEGSAHSFEQRTFSSLTFCNLCRDFMWGITNTGVSCVCKILVAFSHFLYFTDLPNKNSENQDCGFAAHSRCIEGITPPTTCKLTNLASLNGLTTLEDEQETLKLLGAESVLEIMEQHHWIEGNCHLGRGCFICDESITSIGCDSFRCSRCKIQVHTSCLMNSPSTICIPKFDDLLVKKRSLYHERSSPLLVFINSRSGGQQGEYLLRKFRKLLLPFQVIDLNNQQPLIAIKTFMLHPSLSILCCGGDGTVGWVLSVLDQIPNFFPNVAVLPLGTGNDLARTLNWGGGYAEEKLSMILNKLLRASVVELDRWLISIKEIDPKSDGESANVEETAKHIKMNNYFSIGVDAEVALAFHNLRNEAPALCSSRLGNKFWYVVNGVKTMLGQIALVDQFVQVEVDGKNCWLDENIGAIIILNLPSYMGGADLWGPPKDSDEFKRPAINDKMLEIVAVTGSFHLANVSINLASAIRLAQGSHIKIKFIKNQNLHVQVDGEPWLQPPCEIEIGHLNQVNMLKAANEEVEDEESFLDFEGTLF